MRAGRLVLVALIALLATGAWGDVRAACTTHPEGDIDTYVLLVGWPGVPPGEDALRPLGAIPGDLVAMHAFFSALKPRCIFVHGPRLPKSLSEHAAAFDMGAPEWLAVRDSVDVIARTIDDAPARPARVYLYYGGHGLMRTSTSGRGYTSLFLEPQDPESGEPGADGEITAQMFQDGLLAPFADVDTVLIVDACQSFFVLETRGERSSVKRRHRRTEWVYTSDDRYELIGAMAQQYSRLLALTATSGNESAFESEDYGGLFSYALRSAGVGQADFDRDGVVDGRELGRLVPFILSTAGVTRPRIFEPLSSGAADDPIRAPHFVSLADAQGAVPLEVDVDRARRFEVWLEPGVPYAVLHPGAGQKFSAWLPRGKRYRIAERSSQSPSSSETDEWQFDTIDVEGPLRLSDIIMPRGESRRRGIPVGRGVAPMTASLDQLPPESIADDEPIVLAAETFPLVSVMARADAYPAGGPDGLGFVAGPELRASLVLCGRHWLSAEFRYGAGRGLRAHREGGQNRYVFHRGLGSVAYRLLLMTGRSVELLAGVSVGGGIVQQQSGESETRLSAYTAEADLDLRWLPDGGTFAIRAGLSGGSEWLGASPSQALTIGFGLGAEWEL